MAKTVVGLFDDYATAQRAAAALEQDGFTSSDVSMVAAEETRDKATSSTTFGTDVDGSHTAERAGVGAGVGATVGGLAGLLVGIGALAIPGVGPIIAAGPIVAVLAGAGIGAAAGGLIGALTTLGVPDEHAGYYAEGIKRGGTLLTVRAEDAKAQIAADTLTQYGAVDVERKAASWNSQTSTSNTMGTNTMGAAASNLGTTGTTGTRDFKSTETRTATSATGERAIPIVEEQLEVGKREVEGRGVRIYSEMTERPVQEKVSLREEHIHVERRPVDKAIDPKELDAFRDQEISLTERSEQAVVGKTARVVEEVIVGKDVAQRTETVTDTVRRTDVRVEETGNRGATATSGGTSTQRMAFDTLDPNFRTNWDSKYRSSGGSYDQMQPAYRYGYDLASDARYNGREWNDVESTVRTSWEKDRPGTWESMKDAVRYAWDHVRGRSSNSSQSI